MTTSEQQTWTIKKLLDWTSEYFSSKEIDQPRFSAEVLLAESLDCQRIDLYTRFDQEPSEAERSKFRDWVKRHAEGEPVAYLVGHREFYSLKFEVDSSVLIPRPETEHLVTETIDLVQKEFADRPVKMIDVGTGSGIIAVTLAKHLPNIQITAVDISEKALEVAKANAEQHQVKEKIEFVKSDLFGAIDSNDFDFVVSNPPYIGQSERDSLPLTVREYEPEVALFAPTEDGAGIIRRLVDEAATHLKGEGYLLFELSPIISSVCLEIVNASHAFAGAQIVKDLAKLDRILVTKRTK